MPSHSRSRDRYRDRDRERERERARQRHRGDDEAYDESPDSRRHHGRHHSRGQSRGYESHDYYERDVDEQGDEDDPTTIDPRRRLAEPADIRSSPIYDRGGEGRRRERSKAKESPATSPIKKRDRQRDREGHRRRESRADDGSPTKGARIRERRHRETYADEEGDRDREAERELRRQRRRERERERERKIVAEKHVSADSATSSSQLLSADSLAKLTVQYQKEQMLERERTRKEEKRRRRREGTRGLESADETPKKKRKQRIVSGAVMEEGRSPNAKAKRRGGGGAEFDTQWRKEGDGDDYSDGVSDEEKAKKRKKWMWIGIGAVIILLIIIIPTAVVVSKKKGGDSSDPASPTSSSSKSNLDGINPDSIPAAAKGTVLDPFTWYDTTDFNLTYTNETVGGLPIMGLNSTWDDSARANDNVPPLNQNFSYGTQPIRGVNLGGWLSIEPFITPSLFDQYSARDGVVDEWTLSKQLGQSAATTIEKHYATFITEQDFASIRDAGLDHVRIQYSYWAVTTYDGDPYVAKISWRYLLRAIEYCRKYGLRVDLDLHGLPGSQNGWNHSGRQGPIGWLNGTDGDLNRQRSLDIHDQLSKFFAQPRYKNVVTIYGLANEPMMLSLPIESVLDWTTQAAELVQKNGITAWIAFGDGFLNLSKWKSMLKTGPSNLLLDTHQYTIFNTGQIGMNHTAKVNLVCTDWVGMLGQVNTVSEGWGPTICGEWSQADTDCAQFLNNVNWGARWVGTYETGDSSTSVTTPLCPTAQDGPGCDCGPANADASAYSADYKKWLQTYAEAQMHAFEQAHGWFYWTWQTESAAQWSYKTAWQNGFMPKLAYQPSFKCGDTPDFGSLAENY